ncbi:hypothetical protein B0I27_103332 [Arcticibacter pallidicorallinus]|uniref:Uncharacterized protein n=1 Tax=Arcticibacter pallidicorallinus TaxID=1259464 RepID=A0A2T0U7H5_9SPHI|nr:DUF4175 family protein [Arcticibacter pallidicorallinus]PRY53859.1 hypothetical protein B0I27_103332 [Arcticibacter pallidicorallinus]
MGASDANYAGLIAKIDEFIRKYYLNQIVRGSLYLAAALMTGYIFVTISAYFGNFSPAIRAVFFYSFILLQVGVFLRFLLIPLMGYFSLGKRIDHNQASLIIGKHFPHVQDKLLNAIQLKELSGKSPEASSLIESAINQKIAELKPVPFQSAIRIGENRKYLRYALPPLFVIILVALTAPYILSEGTERVIHYKKTYEKKAPFRFVLLNEERTALQGEDFIVQLKLVGNEVPDAVYLEDGPNTFKIEKVNTVNFKHTFKNLQKTKTIRFKGGDFFSEPFVIEVQERPSIAAARVDLIYPGYLNRKNERKNSLSDLTVPSGTRIAYRIVADHTPGLRVVREDGIQQDLEKKDNSAYHYSLTATKSLGIQFSAKGRDTQDAGLVNFRVNVVPDEAPSIQIVERKDSLDKQMAFFLGQVNDDHGFKDLRLMYRMREGSTLSPLRSKAIILDRLGVQQSFFRSVSAADFKLQPGQDLEFYFEVRDNDATGGYKRSSTEVMRIARPSVKETVKQVEQSQRITEAKLKQAITEASVIESTAKRLNRDLIDERELSYSQKKQVADLLQKQKELEQLIKETKEESEKSRMNQKDLYADADAITEQQRQLEKLLDQVLDEKTRELLKDIEKMLQENHKAGTQQEISKMQAGSREVQKELDRILELYKHLEFEQKLAHTLDELKTMAADQKHLAKNISSEAPKRGETLRQQQGLSQKFKSISKDLASLEEKSRILERGGTFDQSVEKQAAIVKAQSQSEKSISAANVARAKKEMESAGEEMEALSSGLEKARDNSQTAGNRVKMRTLNQILDNLLKSSFDQEKLLKAVNGSQAEGTSVSSYTQTQMRIKDNMKTIGDSLYALSRILPQIESAVNMEVQNITHDINSSIESLAERVPSEAVKFQQRAMTSMNDLTLLIDEVRAQLDRAMKNSSGQGQGQQKSLSQLIQQQDELNKNMQKAREQLKQNGQPDGRDKGEHASSENMAKMAREQNLIKRALEDFTRNLMTEGVRELGNLQKLAKDMEQSERALVNKKIELETMNRQRDILARLLQAEHSERERELDDKRESRQGMDVLPGAVPLLQQLEMIKAREIDYLRTVPPGLNSFYQLKVGDYYRSLTSKQ